MADFITLTCPSCGSKLKITEEIERFACISCGNEHIVKRGEGAISIQPVVEGIAKVQVGVDKTASELAIVRINRELHDLEDEYRHLSADYPGGTGSSSSMIFYIGIVTIIFFLLALFVFRNKNYDGLIIVTGAALISIGFLYSVFMRVKEREATIEMKLIKLENKITDKKKELKQHMKIVSG